MRRGRSVKIIHYNPWMRCFETAFKNYFKRSEAGSREESRKRLFYVFHVVCVFSIYLFLLLWKTWLKFSLESVFPVEIVCKCRRSFNLISVFVELINSRTFRAFNTKRLKYLKVNLVLYGRDTFLSWTVISEKLLHVFKCDAAWWILKSIF